MQTFEDFQKEIRRVDGHVGYKPRRFQPTYRTRALIQRALHEMDKEKRMNIYICLKAITRINEELAKLLIAGNEVSFPNKMGTIDVRKHKTTVYFDDKGKLVNTHPINWDKTLKLWFSDSKAKANKTLIRTEQDYAYKIYYKKVDGKCCYKNRTFTTFHPCRNLKKMLRDRIRQGDFQCYNIKQKDDD